MMRVSLEKIKKHYYIKTILGICMTLNVVANKEQSLLTGACPS